MTGALLTIATIGYDFNRGDSCENSDWIDASGMGRDKIPTAVRIGQCRLAALAFHLFPIRPQDFTGFRGPRGSGWLVREAPAGFRLSCDPRSGRSQPAGGSRQAWRDAGEENPNKGC